MTGFTAQSETSSVLAAAAVERPARQWPFLLALVLQNVAIFWGHYFGTVGIPWDFSMSYYAMVAFWTTAVRQGVFPQWIPFQQMGYPFALQVQSGMNYLPLWIFPALNIPYTLHAAIVFQCLHVLAGSAGMFMLARLVTSSRRYALVAAVAFQCFGGFYSNAEHVDIVRAFACAPWLLYAFSLDAPAGTRLPRRAMLIPPVLFLFLTGAYPGNVIAGGVIIGLFLILQLIDALVAGAAPLPLLALGSRIAGLGLLGCGMASLQLGPVWLFRDQFVRAGPLGAVPRIGLWLDHLPGLFLSNATLHGEISMTSTYVSLPLLMLASFTPRSFFKQGWVYLTVGLVATLMAAGDRIVIGPLLTTALPVLGLSRFPSSDYRVFIAVTLILLSLSGLRAVATGRVSVRALAVRAVFCVAWLSWGLAHVYHTVGRETALAAAVATASLAAIVILWRRAAGLTVVGLTVVVVLISVDATRVLSDMPGWHEPDIDAYYFHQGWPPYTRNRGRQLAASSVVRNFPPSRPPRTVPAGLVRWSGYMDGQYLTTDLTPNILRAASLVQSNDLFQRYMLREWSPLLLTPGRVDTAASQVVLSEADLAAALADTTPTLGETVTQTRYGINDIDYRISLKETRLLVENEMYFPGWRARLSTSNEVRDAVAINGVFRAWLLPAGDYTMTSHFEFPHLLELRVICVAASLTWLALWLISIRRGP